MFAIWRLLKLRSRPESSMAIARPMNPIAAIVNIAMVYPQYIAVRAGAPTPMILIVTDGYTYVNAAEGPVTCVDDHQLRRR